MWILILDTSLQTGTIGMVRLDVRQGDPCVLECGHVCLPAIPGHAECLLDRLSLVAAGFHRPLSGVDLLVLVRGPGTFTGLRIGYATAKGIHLVHRIPLVTVSSLEMAACSAGYEGNVVSLMDARRGELYMGAFQINRAGGWLRATERIPEQVVCPKDVCAVLQNSGIGFPVRLAGNGFLAYSEELRDCGTLPLSPTPPDVCTLAVAGYRQFLQHGGADPSFLEPTYLREPDARLPETGQRKD